MFRLYHTPAGYTPLNGMADLEKRLVRKLGNVTAPLSASVNLINSRLLYSGLKATVGHIAGTDSVPGVLLCCLLLQLPGSIRVFQCLCIRAEGVAQSQGKPV